MARIRPELLAVFLVCCSSPTDQSSPDSGGSGGTPSSLFGEAGRAGSTVSLNDLDGGVDNAADGAEPDALEPMDGGAVDALGPDGGEPSDAGEPLADAAGPTWVHGPCEPCNASDPDACDPGLVCQTFTLDIPRCWPPCKQCAEGESPPCTDFLGCEAAYGTGHFVCFGPQKICTPYDGVSNYSDVKANCESFLK